MDGTIEANELIALRQFIADLGCQNCASAPVDCRSDFIQCSANSYNVSLSNANLSGFLNGSAFSEMAHCAQLSLERNSLSGTLPPQLFGTSALSKLYLRGNRLSGTLPTQVRSAQLVHVWLGDNLLSGTIPTAFFQLPKIVHLHFENNSFSGNFPVPPVNVSASLDNFLGGDNTLPVRSAKSGLVSIRKGSSTCKVMQID